MNYQEYRYTKKEFITYLSYGLILSSLLAYLFYQSIIAVILFSPFSIVYMKQKRFQLIEKRKWQLNLEFREGILCLSAALNAGYSIENAFVEAIKDLRMMFSDHSYIIPEFEYITQQIKMNVTVEEALKELALRSDVEDISNFSEVFSTAKRTGGDIIKIIRVTGRNIGDKIEIKREIQTLITAKKLEARVMNIIPFGMIVYLWVSSPGFLDPLYHNFIGIMIMSFALLLYYFAYRLSEKIINIQV
jgi:tight adherence protein B